MLSWFRRLWHNERVPRRRLGRPRCTPRVESLENRCLPATGFLQINLVSDIPGVARTTDPNLVNPWGIVASSTSPFWISDNGKGVSTLYTGTGLPAPVGSPLVVTIPVPTGGTPPSAPTGIVFNGTSSFVVSSGGKSGPALFLFATEDGTISGWSPAVNSTNAILEVDNSAAVPSAVYKGLALGSNAQGNFLFATNFRAGTVDVFDSHIAKATLAGSFADPNIPAGFAPFGIRNINGLLYVTYALQDAAKHDDVAGVGNGFVDVFDTNGDLVRRLASHGTLNSPWGLAVAPADFGEASNDLLVGNFGDGHINVLDPTTGAFLGQLNDPNGNPVAISGLWGLTFGNGSNGAKQDTLFFTAGLNGESDGLFGTLESEAAPANEHFVAQLYRDLLHREADPGGLAGWSALLDQGVSRLQVAQDIESSPEFFGQEVQAAFQLLLHRAAEPAAQAAFSNFLEMGGTVEQMKAIIAGSPEYFQTRGGGTNDGFVTALYQDGLGRAPDPTGRADADAALNAGLDRAVYALSLLTSQEADQHLVTGLYQSLLRRKPDAGGLNADVMGLMGGMRDETLIAIIVSSPEYATLE